MDSLIPLRASDPAVVSRYLQLRGLLHDRFLAQLEAHVLQRYEVQPTTRIPATLPALVRKGFLRAGEGEVWPVVFLTPVDITLTLCLQITSERLTKLGTVLHGPQRLRHRHWEDWWGWETTLPELNPKFYELSAEKQEEAMIAWCHDRLEWLVQNGLLKRKTGLQMKG